MFTDIKYVVIATKKDTREKGFIRIEEGGYPYFTSDFSPALLVYNIKYATEDANLVAEHFKDEFDDITVVEIAVNYEFGDNGLQMITTTKRIDESN